MYLGVKAVPEMEICSNGAGVFNHRGTHMLGTEATEERHLDFYRLQIFAEESKQIIRRIIQTNE